ncbi:ribosomal protein S18-alanine N-acetyltransferase [Agathobaculum sp.]|uniref:ribosomal protein S18-alanine N-acetyltransferase n=1 Tax=Agathobaculum sp. TaxID=2048138 RepID=UPI002A7F14A4|nr:ribosomal protein S18-alanine N-acetyltransferase [Agathobaculum sp.]MDY3617928.1 ribosomal protein S18-alanine N-acetyltransferase [Agathobaculum sp.]
MSGLQIVPVEDCHLPALAHVERACFAAPWSEDALRDELGRGIFLAAEQDGEVAGYVGCQTVLDEGYVTNVAVSPAFRRQGIGRALVSALLSRAQDMRLSFVTLEARASNAPAIALYKGAGFRVVGTRKGFYRNPAEDALLMTCYLKETD